MSKSYTLACGDFPGMEGCPGRFTAGTRDEVLQLAATHAKIAHDENPADWSAEEKAQLEAIISEN